MSEFQPEFSGEIAALAKALAAAQGELQDAKKDAKNPHFKTMFASLVSVRAAITPVFSKHGLSVVQLNEPHGVTGVCVVTLLMHESGQWIRSRLFVPVSKADAQGFGSAQSYARRYALAAIANLATDDDDDAEQASKPAKPQAVTSPPAKSDVDVDALERALQSATDAETMAKAILAVGRVKEKLPKGALEKLMAVRANRVRELGMEGAA